MEVHEDSHVDQAYIIRHEDKKIHLKRIKKNQEFDIENEDRWHNRRKSHGGFSENSSPLRDVHNNVICESTLKLRPSSAPRRMELSKSKEENKSMNGFDFNTNEKNELNAIGTYRSRGVKGVKEDCERFRLQMKILKEKANDSRIREVMVEGMKFNVTTIDIADGVVENDERIEKNLSVLKNIVSSTHNLNIEGDRIVGIDESFLAQSTMNRRSKSSSPYNNTSNFEGKNNRQNNAHDNFKARKRIKTSSTSSTASSLSTLPLSHYIQKLKCLAPISRCPPNPSTSINKNTITKDNIEQTTLIDTKPSIDIALMDCQNDVEDPHNFNIYSTENLKESFEDGNNSNFNKYIPSSSTLYSESNIRMGIFACQRTKKPYITYVKSNNMPNHGEKINKKVGKIMFTNSIPTYEKKPFNEESSKVVNTMEEFYIPILYKIEIFSNIRY
ncbi:hypothetical protein KC19_5G056100 [Ceratodon purpureus]|uniref:Uncharacterized protein n=1 Tax=Ceratodon purpureus TaxID=3225 RepID=A0A8T0I0N6_CERPU|nr:hypothetical protein KC19_5G056100 [Ceratodon purpureus]